MKKVLQMAESVATSRAAILLLGESGTGKELLARYVHAKSSRSGKEFVAINCAAVPEGLLESELFGYEKGAFTGADQRKIGKFELAHQGTFLFDEVSELPLALQAKLLRVVQEGEIERLGGAKPIKVYVRIIAATNKNLQDMVARGEFREDLYYRLNVIPILIPPLRQRHRDIELLSQLFLEIACEENNCGKRTISREAMQKLLAWKWPGNVRELQNVIERSALLARSEEITTDDIAVQATSVDSPTKPIEVGLTVSEAERRLIVKTLEFTQNNRTQAAHILGISIRTLRNKLNEYRAEAPQ
jgi:transcriptional regulator with PAS, ATPase and Fis domain